MRPPHLLTGLDLLFRARGHAKSQVSGSCSGHKAKLLGSRSPATFPPQWEEVLTVTRVTISRFASRATVSSTLWKASSLQAKPKRECVSLWRTAPPLCLSFIKSVDNNTPAQGLPELRLSVGHVCHICLVECHIFLLSWSRKKIDPDWGGWDCAPIPLKTETAEREDREGARARNKKNDRDTRKKRKTKSGERQTGRRRRLSTVRQCL